MLNRIRLISILLLVFGSVLVGCSNNACKQINLPVMSKLPNNPSLESVVYYGLGDAALQNQDFQNALPLLQLAEKFDPNSILIKQDMVETYWSIARSQNSAPTDMLKYGEDIISKGQYNEQILGIMADAYVLQKEPRKAIDVIAYLVKHKPSGMNYFRLFILNAKYLNKIKKDLLDGALQRAGDNEYLLLAIGDVYSQLDPMRAEAVFNKAYITFKDDLSFKALSNYYIRQNQKTKLINTLRKNIKSLNENQLQMYIELLYQTNQWKEIIANKDHLLAEGNSMVLRYLFAASQQEKDIDLMILAFDKIKIEADITADDKGSLALTIGDAYLQKNDSILAAQYFAQVSNYRILLGYVANKILIGNSLDSKSSLLTTLELLNSYGYSKELQAFMIANTQYLLDDSNAAINSIQTIPDSYFSENNMIPEAAQIYLAAGNDSLKALQLLDLRKEKTPSTNTLMGQFYMFAQKDSIAERYFDKEYVSNPTPDSLFFRYAATLADRHKRLNEEEELLDKAITLYPNNTEFLNWYGYFLVMQNKELEKAEKLIRKAVEIDSTNGFFWDSLAWLLYMKGSYQEAMEAMKIPIQSRTKNSVISYHLGEITYKLNQLKDAKAHFKQAITVNDDQQAVKNSQKALANYTW